MTAELPPFPVDGQAVSWWDVLLKLACLHDAHFASQPSVQDHRIDPIFGGWRVGGGVSPRPCRAPGEISSEIQQGKPAADSDAQLPANGKVSRIVPNFDELVMTMKLQNKYNCLTVSCEPSW